MVSKNDLSELTNLQLKDIIKQIKNKLKLSIAGKTKQELVDTIYNLHHKNKFFGKKLLSFDNSAHITVPERQIQAPNLKKIEEKRIRKLKETKKGQLQLLENKFKKLKNPSLGQIEAFKAKLRVIKKM
jgi:hypothetical protein